ncbi:4-hydroxy-4-methyl-2-oxoglutarate aldolase/4-carboxy-4-hydroxy-2-oxoadipate aldolase [Streptomyces sp. RB5]|uniref:Putative 4-hydroxy-4-methyl-2-oxoglutarate aldolase n=1 Tax=Streptomyces smaragdinus TaxID=2585196 RepID=A0A7K0CLE9_9ACTN|nr:RraA family protein [Streptomyces smaragdinus]MQY14315.1 4-hydroxy-4-methyl-2-oxoglutarate aldolase/4-carboxy-4-hydroxy-2-oxoadipate aldolase [Streptomyces smaragdinus]
MDTEAIGRLRQLDACTVSDALDSLGILGTPLGIRPMWEGAAVVGRAVTMKLAPFGEGEAEKPVHLGAAAIEASGPGDVIVIDNGGRVGMGSWGGLLSTAAIEAGVAGVVSDGALRDVDEARVLGFPVFARAPITRTARARATEVSQGEPVEIDGITVRSGDIVVADGSGVVVVPAERLAEVVGIAEGLARREAGMVEGLRKGLKPSEVMGPEYQNALKRAQQ